MGKSAKVLTCENIPLYGSRQELDGYGVKTERTRYYTYYTNLPGLH